METLVISDHSLQEPDKSGSAYYNCEGANDAGPVRAFLANPNSEGAIRDGNDSQLAEFATYIKKEQARREVGRSQVDFFQHSCESEPVNKTKYKYHL